MQLYAKTMNELICEYTKLKKPDEKISPNLANTILTIFDALVELISKKDMTIEKITVKDLCIKAGYSRTTFYVHFYDVYDVISMLAEMMLYHMELNSEPYYLLFWDQLDENQIKEIYDMLSHYGKYIIMLISRDPTFSQRYREKFVSLIVKDSESRNNWDVHKNYYSLICATVMIESYLFWLQNSDKIRYSFIAKTCSRITEATIYSEESIW